MLYLNILCVSICTLGDKLWNFFYFLLCNLICFLTICISSLTAYISYILFWKLSSTFGDNFDILIHSFIYFQKIKIVKEEKDWIRGNKKVIKFDGQYSLAAIGAGAYSGGGGYGPPPWAKSWISPCIGVIILEPKKLCPLLVWWLLSGTPRSKCKVLCHSHLGTGQLIDICVI